MIWIWREPKPRVDRGGAPVSVGVVAPESPYVFDAMPRLTRGGIRSVLGRWVFTAMVDGRRD